jgi:hypothetical protein
MILTNLTRDNVPKCEQRCYKCGRVVALGSHVILMGGRIRPPTLPGLLLILHMLRVIFFYICYFVNEIYWELLQARDYARAQYKTIIC